MGQWLLEQRRKSAKFSPKAIKFEVQFSQFAFPCFPSQGSHFSAWLFLCRVRGRGSWQELERTGNKPETNGAHVKRNYFFMTDRRRRKSLVKAAKAWLTLEISFPQLSVTCQYPLSKRLPSKLPLSVNFWRRRGSRLECAFFSCAECEVEK